MNNITIFDVAITAAPQATTYTKTEVEYLLELREPICTLIPPLQKLTNMPSGTFSIGVDTMLLNPYHVAGRIDLATQRVKSSKGIYCFSFIRTQTGFAQITFTEPHPDGANFTCLTAGEGEGANAWNFLHNINSGNLGNTSTTLTLIVRDNNFNVVSGVVCFYVLV